MNTYSHIQIYRSSMENLFQEPGHTTKKKFKMILQVTSNIFITEIYTRKHLPWKKLIFFFSKKIFSIKKIEVLGGPFRKLHKMQFAHNCSISILVNL